MNKDALKLKGRVKVERFDSRHNLIDAFEINNRIVNQGLNYFVDRLLGFTNYQLTHIGVGSNATPSAVDNNEDTFQNLAIAPIRLRKRKSETENVIQLQSIIPEGLFANKTVAEFGLFYTGVNGVKKAIARTVITSGSQFVKRDDEFLSVTWEIQLG